MKRKLLYLTTIMLFSALTLQAQRVWDMGNDQTNWPSGSANMTDAQVTINGLTIVAGSTFGAISGRALTWDDGYTSVQEFKGNGSSGGYASNLPTTRYFTFPVTGPTTVKVYFRVNGTGGRACMISDGTNLLGQLTDEDSSKPLLLTVNYTGGAGNIYVFAYQSINYFKIESSDAALGVDSNSVVVTDVYAAGNSVYVSNVKSSTQIEVYSMSGALVKSLSTDADTSFELNSGVYVVKATSAEGTKSVKVIVQ